MKSLKELSTRSLPREHGLLSGNVGAGSSQGGADPALPVAA